jgi:uncharacterized zinc-type alcohol dehydrogenase-like protein
MSTSIHAWAAEKAGGPLLPFRYNPGPLHDEQVEIHVEHCGICHSDLSMIDNEWGNSVYPLVAGHEIVGTVVARGEQVKGLKVGDKVGLGWASGSCMHCTPCMEGHHNLCAQGEKTIVGRHGGFADRVRGHWRWVQKLPEKLPAAKAGPLFCGGSTVFSPLLEFGVRPTDRVGIVGVGGLGHLALQFLNKWGCEVTAFTSSASKQAEARALGAHQVVTSTDDAALKKLRGCFDFILVTVNVSLDWARYVAALKPRGRLHFVGAVLEPLQLNAFHLIGGQKQLSGSPVGSPATVATMLEFCTRHDILPQTEHFPMSRINDAIAHLRAGKARYRVVLDAEPRASS